MLPRPVLITATVSFHRPLLMMLSAESHWVCMSSRPEKITTTVSFHRNPTDDAHQLRTTKFACPPDQRWLPLLCSSTDRSPQCGLWCWRLRTELFQARKQAAMPRLRSAQLHGVSGHRKCDKFWLHSIFSHRKCESFTMQQWMMMMMMMMTIDDPMKVRFTSRFCLMKSQMMLSYCNYHRVSVLFGQMSKIFQVDNCLALRSKPPRSLPKWASAPVPSVLHMGWKLSHGSDGIRTHNRLACTPNFQPVNT